MLTEYDNKYNDYKDTLKYFEPIKTDFSNLLEGYYNIKDAITLL
jgi:hypothetical protein